MKRIATASLVLISLLALTSSPSHGRAIWEKVVQPDWQTHFNDIYALPAIGQAWAVGDSGVIAHTTDSGLTWTAQTSGTSSGLQAVHFASPVGPSPDNGLIVGEAATIRWTVDGGSTWFAGSTDVTNTLYDVFFWRAPSTLVFAWAVGGGGAIIMSINGGATWTEQVSGTSSRLYGVTFWDVSTGWAVGACSTILNTTDGGASWSDQSGGLPGGFPNRALRDVDFISATDGWIVGEEGRILTTTDGGTSWAEQASGTTQYLYSIDFIDSGLGWGWIAGGQTYDPGIILRSTNSGSTWLSQVTNKQLLGISFININEGIAAGRHGVIMRSDDSGASWSQVTDTAANLHGYDSPDADNSNAWAAGSQGTVYRTTDSWATWTDIDTGVYSDLNAVSFPSQTYGWTVGMGRKPYQHVPTPTPPHTVLKTTDGGSTWAPQVLPTRTPGVDVDENMYDVFMLNTSSGWICGQWGSIFRTADGGSNWLISADADNDAYDEANTLHGIHFVDQSEGLSCGTDGLMVYSGDGGVTWTSQTTNVDVDLYDVLMIDTNNSFAVGAGNTVIKTTDGGTSWTRVIGSDEFTCALLYGVDFNDLNAGLTVGSSGRAYRGGNEGWSWAWQGAVTVTSFDVYDVLMISDINAWASVAWGEVLKYTSVSDTPPLGVVKGQGAGFDLNYYQYWSSAPGDVTYWDAVGRNPSPYYYARDLWAVPQGNDIVAAAPLDIDGDGYDEIGVMRNQAGDYNFFVYEALDFGDTNFWDALARNPSPIARDFWYIPSGNNTVAIAGADGDGDGFDEVAVLKNEFGGQKLYYYNCPRRGDWTWGQAFGRNRSVYAFDEWYVPRNNSILAMAGADSTGDGTDNLVTVENAWGDYNLFVWQAPGEAQKYTTELFNRFLQNGFGTPDNPTGLGNPQAQDLWVIPQRDDIISITGVLADDAAGQYPGTYDALGVMESLSGDWNYYLWKVPVKPESTQIEAEVRQLGFGGLGTPQGRDFWVIPGVPSGRSRWILGLWSD